MLDTRIVDKYMNKYPMLEAIFQAGVVSLKLTREVIDVDRWLMNDIYKDLLLAGAVKGLASGAYRATEECLEYIERRNILRCRTER